MRPILTTLVLFSTAACGPKVGVVDPQTGLVGHPVEEGALAGTWGMLTNFATLVTIPVLGDREAGGNSTRLVQRTWDAKLRAYSDTFIRCTNAVSEVEGARTIVLEQTLLKMSPSSYVSHAAHADGTFSTDPVIDLWGVHHLPDPALTPLPTHANYETPPNSDYLWDEDEDGHPGVTVHMRGTLAAELYLCKRNIYTFDGTILAPDRVQGLIRQGTSESNSVKSTVSWMEGEGSSKPNPDPLRSWFDMVRLEEGAGCEEVKAAVAAGQLATGAPFAPTGSP